jgi:hypothetical protein
MVQGTITLPRHNGSDGPGLPVEVIEELVGIIKQGLFTEEQIAQAINLCMESSIQDQWNEEYIPLLLEKLKED